LSRRDVMIGRTTPPPPPSYSFLKVPLGIKGCFPGPVSTRMTKVKNERREHN
jgi:hypothetical protein